MTFIYTPQRHFFNNEYFVLGSESLFTMLAFLFLGYFIIKEFRKQKINLKIVEWIGLFIAVIFGSMAGGRLWYYIEHWNGPETLISLFDLSRAGLISFGMIIGGMLSILLFVYFNNKKSNLSWKIIFPKYMDTIGIGAALYIFIYRMGCFHNGDVPGIETNVPWGMFAINYRQYSGQIIHPTALYLSISGLLIFLFLYWYKDRKRFAGEIGLLFLIMFSFNRFIIEFFRVGENILYIFNQSQVILFILFFLGIIWYFITKRISNKVMYHTT